LAYETIAHLLTMSINQYELAPLRVRSAMFSHNVKHKN